MQELEPKLRRFGYADKADAFKSKISEITLREARKRELENAQKVQQQERNAESLLNALDIDSF